MKILVVSAYDAQSHRYWHSGMQRHLPHHDWTIASLPARYFAWRARGNSLSFAFEKRELLEHPYDLVIATSMTDLSALRGFVPNLAKIPTLVYFHENQFAYPDTEFAKNRLELQVLNLYTALSADLIAFNSHYNRHSFLEGVRTLLSRMPDHAPLSICEELATRSCVLPVPLESASIDSPDTKPEHAKTTGPLDILWNHRWEHDKGPDILFCAMDRLKDLTDDFRLHLVGQQFRSQPEAFEQIKSRLGKNLGHCGFIEKRKDYTELLHTCDIVLSTALHDFQGISVMEAVSAGCVPLVPDRLAYRDIFPERYRYCSGRTIRSLKMETTDTSVSSEGHTIADQLMRYCELKSRSALPPAPDLGAYFWQSLTESYEAVFLKTRQAFESGAMSL